MASGEPKKCRVKFQVRESSASSIYSQAKMYVVGSASELGEWTPKRARPMHRDPAGSGWTVAIDLPQSTRVEYRYTLADATLDTGDVTVFSWETNLEPRWFQTEESECVVRDDEYGKYGGSERVSRGWLSGGQTQVRLAFCPTLETAPFHLYHTPADSAPKAAYSLAVGSRLVGRPSLMHRLTQHFQGYSGGAPSYPATPTTLPDTQRPPLPVYVQVVDGVDYEPQLVPQPFGKSFQEDEFLVFSCQTPDYKSTVFKIELYSSGGGSRSDDWSSVGVAQLPSSALTSSSGYTTLILYDQAGEPVGELRVQYLVITPLTPDPCTMEVTFDRYWNRRRKTLDIGHRGLGRSFNGTDSEKIPLKLAPIAENTIDSFNAALNMGAEYVEFDVYITKDMQPVVFHDFEIHLQIMEEAEVRDKDRFIVGVSQLTLEQLRSLKFVPGEASSKVCTFKPEKPSGDSDEKNLFPTLQEVFDRANPLVGFNIEIKYPMPLIDGSHEQQGTLVEMNSFMDVLLTTVMANSHRDRRIVFSSFHPDICSMVRMKQNRYPVSYLLQDRLCPSAYRYVDPRTANTAVAAHFALAEQIMGVAACAEDVMREQSLVEKVRSHLGLVLFVWGNDLNHFETKERIKELGADAIIHDRIAEYKGGVANTFMLEERLKQATNHYAQLSLAGLGHGGGKVAFK